MPQSRRKLFYGGGGGGGGGGLGTGRDVGHNGWPTTKSSKITLAKTL